MSKEIKRISTLIAIVFIVLLTYALFYYYNNKFTYDTLRAENGILNLNAEFDSNPITFLVGPWQFYEGFYTPETLAQNKPEIRMYIPIEESPWDIYPTDLSQESSGGTFRLEISTGSKEPKKYIFEVPEIKSPYCLWINGEEIISCTGRRYREYIPEAANNYIGFSADETVEIVFYITDIVSAYNKISYPPAFGYMERTSRYLTLNLILSAVFFGTSVAIACLYSLSFIWTKYKSSTLAIIFLCISLAWLSAYPIIHFINLPGIHIWFVLERFFYNALLLSVIYLLAIICRDKCRLTKFFIYTSIGFCLISPVVSLLEGDHLFFSSLYSNTEILYRLLVAAYLALGSAKAIVKNDARPTAIAYAIFIFALSIPEEIFLTEYEPLYIGLPYQLGLLVFIVIFTVYVSREPIELYHANKNALMQNTLLMENSKIINEQLIVQENQYKLIAEYVETANAAKHDLRHHIYAIKNYADAGDIEKLNNYLTNYIEHIEGDTTVQYSKNMALNALMLNYGEKCAAAGIEFDSSIDIGEDIGVTNYDLCIIFGNCLENAYEACQLMKSGEKFINVKTRLQGNLLSIQFINSYDGIAEKSGKGFISRKEKREIIFVDKAQKKIRGIGTASVQAVAARYHGAAQFEYNEKTFSVLVLLKV